MAKVKKVEGPFDSNGNLVNAIKLGEQYSYKATPDSVSPADLLKIKWAFKYDNGVIANFKNAKPKVVSDLREILCNFPRNSTAKNITVYAYFNSPSDTVAVKAPVGTSTVVAPTPTSPNTSCSCDRDLTVDEVKSIIIKLRKSESSVYSGVNKEDLFFKDNCKIPSIDKTYERFTEKLNGVFKTYEIDSCIRKMHFLAQTYHETDRYRTTKEYGEHQTYAPYIGRGLMQLTLKPNYEIYQAYSKVNCVSSPELIASSIDNAFDSAGWFWKQGKQLSLGATWKVPVSFPAYINKNRTYSKDTIQYTINGATKSYGTINLNRVADNDDVDLISWLVNGGSNGIDERRNYIAQLKTIFNYPQKCIKKTNIINPTAPTVAAPIANTPVVNPQVNNTVTIRLVRTTETNNSTIGNFTIDNSTIKGFILEEKGPDTTQSGKEQRVPIGTYNLQWHSGQKFKNVLILFNTIVPASRAILIHPGNTAGDTRGCLLPGTTKGVDFVGSSRAKAKEIFDFVKATGIDGAKIIITEAYE